MKTRYCEIIGTPGQLEKFLFILGGTIDDLVERIEVYTGLSPDPLFFKILLLDFSDDIQAQMALWYPGQYFPQVPGYTDAERKTILLAMNGLKRDVVVHEITHMLLNLSFTKQKIPPRLHEIIAQSLERSIVT